MPFSSQRAQGCKLELTHIVALADSTRRASRATSLLVKTGRSKKVARLFLNVQNKGSNETKIAKWVVWDEIKKTMNAQGVIVKWMGQ